MPFCPRRAARRAHPGFFNRSFLTIGLAKLRARAYLHINPDIVETLKGLAPQGAGIDPLLRSRWCDQKVSWSI